MPLLRRRVRKEKTRTREFEIGERKARTQRKKITLPYQVEVEGSFRVIQKEVFEKITGLDSNKVLKQLKKGDPVHIKKGNALAGKKVYHTERGSLVVHITKGQLLQLMKKQ